MARFDSKVWNPEVFQKYYDKIPNTKLNLLIKSGAIRENPQLAAKLVDQVGGNYITEPLKGNLDGSAINYDGVNNITATSRKTYSQGKIVIGRAKAWTEKDFSTELTGEEFLPYNAMAGEVAEYYEGIDQDTLLKILEGIFSMSSVQGTNFKNSHTYDISSGEGSAAKVGAGTLNRAITRACGDAKAKFSVVFMHSDVAVGLEELQLLDYLKYTDANGIQRDLTIGQWNGRLVLVDDDAPVNTTVTTAPVYYTNITTAATAGDKITIAGTEYTFVANDASDTGNKIKVGANGTAAQQVTNIAAKVTVSGFTVSAGTSSDNTKVLFTATSGTNPDAPEVTADPVATTGTLAISNGTKTEAVIVDKYVTYILGDGAIEYANCGAKVPNEMDRDPATNGGVDTLYTRQRKLFAPKYISFTKNSMSSDSPTDAELATGSNWEIANDGNGSYVSNKLIPIARIISKV